MVSENYFELSLDQKKSVNFINEIYLTRAANDLKIYDGFLEKNKNIITGTGGTYNNKLISNLAKKNGSKIWRFNHGGERCFFDDELYWINEFFKTDVYVTYGIKWGNYLRKKIKKNKKHIKVNVTRSMYHKKLFDLYFEKKPNYKKKILYAPNSFVSEGRQLPNLKIIDPVLYDWQKYLLEKLKELKYEIIYKSHPKGFFQEINNLGNIANNKTNKAMIESLRDVDIVILDFAGTAFVEALCAGKDVIYIDMKQRKYNDDNLDEFNSFVKVIPTYIKDGVINLNEE